MESKKLIGYLILGLTRPILIAIIIITDQIWNWL
jgi:hypothetical protein